MARVIITALYVMPTLAPADHRLVVKLARRKASWLAEQHQRASRVIGERAHSCPSKEG
jgi:hypothetical protein